MIATPSATPTLLLVDDDDALLHSFRRFFHPPEMNLLTAASGAEGVRLAGEHQPDAVLLDLNLPDVPGMEVFRRLRALDARTPVIILTGQSSSQNAIEAMKEGAHDYVVKPRPLNEMRALIGRAFHLSQALHAPDRPPAADRVGSPPEGDTMVGSCPAMQEVYKAIGRVAPQDVTVLITGESGTGKELVARAICQYSKRAGGPFLAINCAAIPDSLLESELFGHEKGAFTGAERRRIGKFEQCNGGTIFLDEIGDMAPLTQVKLLRVLQEQAFERVGGNDTIRTDVRILAATNRDLERMVAEGQFRTDLYYRLSVFGIHLPLLRERLADLPLLVDHFLRRFNGELGKQVVQAVPEALELLHAYPWPGNLRELQSVLKQALLQASGPVLLPDFLPPAFRKETAPPGLPADNNLPGLEPFVRSRLEAGSTRVREEVGDFVDRHLLSLVLEHTRGNQVRAAHALGISRGTLRARLRSLGLSAHLGEWSESDQGSEETAARWAT
jgi:two-component system nitrogen regulation response regulator GlnG